MQCDHEKCETKFCPHCGDPIVATPLDELRHYLSKRLAEEQKKHEKAKADQKKLDDGGYNGHKWLDHYQKDIPKKLETSEKRLTLWSRRQTAFIQLMEKAGC